MLQVVAGVLTRRGRLLLTQRPPDQANRELWEFPGGKVERGESHPCALQRELREELGFTDLLVEDCLESVALDGIEVHFYAVTTGETPLLLEHAALGWYRPQEALTLALATRDRAFLELSPTI